MVNEEYFLVYIDPHRYLRKPEKALNLVKSIRARVYHRYMIKEDYS